MGAAMSRWVDQMFDAQAVLAGGVVRRSVHDVRRFGAMDEIVERAQENGWHVVETGDQIVVLCHAGALAIHC